MPATPPVYLTKQWQHARFEKETRYYALSLVQSLWGEWEIVRVNGQKGTRLGRIRYEPVLNYQDGMARLHDLAEYRICHRHYHCVDSDFLLKQT